MIPDGNGLVFIEVAADNSPNQAILITVLDAYLILLLRNLLCKSIY